MFSNPCDRTKPPGVEKKEPKYLDEVQAATLLDLLETESTEYKTMIRLLLFTGLRRGELLGLEWKDIDFDNNTMQICRSSLYLPDKGIFEDETKNATLQIAGGVPLTTVAKRLGHNDTVTTSKIYAHAIKSADEAAAKTLENLLMPTSNRYAG